MWRSTAFSAVASILTSTSVAVDGVGSGYLVASGEAPSRVITPAFTIAPCSRFRVVQGLNFASTILVDHGSAFIDVRKSDEDEAVGEGCTPAHRSILAGRDKG
jgi:hypothetical protein